MLLLITRIEDEDENECREKLEVQREREREREREVTPQLLFNHFELTCVEVTNNIFTILSHSVSIIPEYKKSLFVYFFFYAR